MHEDQNAHQDWNWPGGAQVAVSLTFDVDAESPYLGMGLKYERYLSTLSDGRFGMGPWHTENSFASNQTQSVWIAKMEDVAKHVAPILTKK